MKPVERQLPPQVQSALEECSDQIRFARAVDLARSRRFVEAEALLSPLGQLPATPRELDLLARIAAQQKRYGKAKLCWESAGEKDPHNKGYGEGLQAIAVAEKAAAFWKKVAIIGVTTVVLAGLVAFVASFGPWAKPPPPKKEIRQLQPPSPQQPKTQPTPSQKALPQPQEKPPSVPPKR